MRFPAPAWHWPTGREMADYLEAYARHFRPARPQRRRVERVEPVAGGFGFVVDVAGGRRIAARQVIVATGAFREPNVPDFARRLDPSIRQLHSHEYRNPSQLSDGPVLVVGLSHSGADIAFEAATPATGRSCRASRTARCRSGSPTRSGPCSAGRSSSSCSPTTSLTIRTPRRAEDAAELRIGGGPLLRVRLETSTGRASNATTRGPSACATAGRCSPTAPSSTWPMSIWATGYRPDYSFVARGRRRRGRLAGRGARRQPDRARPVLPRRPVPVRLHVDAGDGRRPRREVRRRSDRRTRERHVDAPVVEASPPEA